MNNSPYISSEMMERIAESVLQNAGVSTQWNRNVARIDIDSLIEFEHGLEIQWKNIDHFSSDGIVLAAIVPKHKVIYMNESQKGLFEQKMGTMNFSKAHELGHWILHVVQQQDYEQLSFTDLDVFYCRNMNQRSREEIQADMFAASILMPKNIISSKINELKASRRPTFSDLYILKDAFEVSISALVARINGLNLLHISKKEIFLNKEEAMGQMSFLL
jgi:Zn-dependent peptidase ImmA (M78 family)